MRDDFQVSSSKNIFFWMLLIGVIGSSVALKYQSINLFSYWLDEAYTVWFAKQSFYDLWFLIPGFESHPPFYYTLVKMWGGAVEYYTGF